MAATKADLLKKCRNKDEVLAWAKTNKLPVRKAGNEITVGSWVCVFDGTRFQYIK
jgi:hypothetical protein